MLQAITPIGVLVTAIVLFAASVRPGIIALAVIPRVITIILPVITGILPIAVVA
jgi:hypothetical protein